MRVYELVVEDLTCLAKMGDQPGFIMSKLFTSIAKAKAFADQYHGSPVEWFDMYNSEDLGSYLFVIQERIVE